MVPEDHTKYVNPKLWTAHPSPPEGRDVDVLKGDLTSASESASESTSSGNQTPLPSGGLGWACFKGIPYTSIISEWWRRNGGEPAEGERNVKLHKLAVNLRAICDNKKDVLMQVMPRFGLSEAELKSVVDSACKEEPKGISKTLSSIIDHLSLTIDHSDEDAAEAAESAFQHPPLGRLLFIHISVMLPMLPQGRKICKEWDYILEN